MHGRIACREATRIKSDVSGKGDKLRLQFFSRNLHHDVVAGIYHPAFRLSLPSLLRIAVATSSAVSCEVSRRMSAVRAYTDVRVRKISENTALGFFACSNGRFGFCKARANSVSSSASSHTATP